MPRRRLEHATSVLRERILDAAEMGALKTGDRLPGTRRLASELGVDQRLIAAAFRRLAQEGLVEVRQRSGAYLAREGGPRRARSRLSTEWVSEIVAQAVERGVPAQRISAAIDALANAQKVRAAVVAGTSDQAIGMVRELQDDYGITAAAVFPDQVRRRPHPAALIRAHLVMTTAEFKSELGPLAASLGKALVVVRVRPDLFSADWIAFMNGPVYVVVADPNFRVALRKVLKPIPQSRNVRILVAGSGDVALIPRDSRTYVTESARRMLGADGLPGRVIRPRRVFSSETVREIVAFLVAHNSAGRTRSSPRPGGGTTT